MKMKIKKFRIEKMSNLIRQGGNYCTRTITNQPFVENVSDAS